MALILTFLGKGGTGRSISAIATAKKLAAQGQRVLLVTQDAGPGFSLLLGATIGAEPRPLAAQLTGVQLQSATLLDKNWELFKQMESQYLRDPFFKAVYGEELGVLPGMDSALALNALREYDASDQYDVIVHDGPGDQTSLRMWGLPEGIDWYFRRFRQVFQASQFARTLTPFIQPVASSILSVNFSGEVVDQPQVKEATNLVQQGKTAINDRRRVRAYLVSTGDEVAIATAIYLWGAAQQIGLTVGGLLLNRAEPDVANAFDPLPTSLLPPCHEGQWEPLMDALPDFLTPPEVPASITVDEPTRTVRLFLPGFDKRDIKLTQYGPEVTVEAGDQRRNLALPDSFQRLTVTGAKFQSGYLIISFG